MSQRYGFRSGGRHERLSSQSFTVVRLQLPVKDWEAVIALLTSPLPLPQLFLGYIITLVYMDLLFNLFLDLLGLSAPISHGPCTLIAHPTYDSSSLDPHSYYLASSSYDSYVSGSSSHPYVRTTSSLCRPLCTIEIYYWWPFCGATTHLILMTLW